MTANQRPPLPAAYMDPAFIRCLWESISTLELVEQFDRLYGADLLKGSEKDMKAFTKFVHESVYLCLADDAVHSLRAAELKSPSGAKD